MKSIHHIRSGAALLVSAAALAWALPSLADDAKPAAEHSPERHAGAEGAKPTRAAVPTKAPDGRKEGDSKADMAKTKAVTTRAELPEGKSDDAKEGSEDAPTTKGMPKNEKAKARRLKAIEHYRAALEKLKATNDLDAAKEDPAAHRKERRAALKALRKAQKEIHAAHAAEAEKFKQRKPEELKALEDKVKKREEKLGKDRKERAEKRRAELREELGEKPVHPAVREELRSHAWRVARLNQLIFLAETDERKEALERAQKLLEKEIESHKERMEKLLSNPKIKDYTPPAEEKAESEDKADSADDGDDDAKAEAADKGDEE